MTHGDKILLPPGHPLIAHTVASLRSQGQDATLTDIEVAHTKLTQITVIGKRQGEGLIAADVKARKAK